MIICQKGPLEEDGAVMEKGVNMDKALIAIIIADLIP
jgi:hypothetical protein